MVSTWKPDTCNCKIAYDKDNNVIVEQTVKCAIHAELDIKTELLGFVTSENQSANELYIDWTPEEVDEHINFIQEYKQAFKEGKIIDPIRDQTPANAKLAYQAKLSLKEV